MVLIEVCCHSPRKVVTCSRVDAEAVRTIYQSTSCANSSNLQCNDPGTEGLEEPLDRGTPNIFLYNWHLEESPLCLV